MKNFEDIMKEVGQFLEQVEEVLNEVANKEDAEQEKKGVSWDELSNWIAESEYIEEFKVDTDAEDLTYTTEDVDDDGLCDCELCAYNDDYYDDYDDCDEETQESEPALEGLSVLDYREALFRHVEKMNPEHRLEEHLKLTDAFSNVIWELLEAPNTATPEEISTAHGVFQSSRYLLASVKSQLNYPGMKVDLLDIENEIENYLKEEN